jgi:hypothetical protein
VLWQYALAFAVVSPQPQVSGIVGVLHSSTRISVLKTPFVPASIPESEPKHSDFGRFEPDCGRNRINVDLFNSAPGPLPDHPEAMKMGLPKMLFSHQAGAFSWKFECPVLPRDFFTTLV